MTPISRRVEYLCRNKDCVGIGHWTVLVDVVTNEFLDEQDGYCPSCGGKGRPA